MHNSHLITASQYAFRPAFVAASVFYLIENKHLIIQVIADGLAFFQHSLNSAPAFSLSFLSSSLLF